MEATKIKILICEHCDKMVPRKEEWIVEVTTCSRCGGKLYVCTVVQINFWFGGERKAENELQNNYGIYRRDINR